MQMQGFVIIFNPVIYTPQHRFGWGDCRRKGNDLQVTEAVP